MNVPTLAAILVIAATPSLAEPIARVGGKVVSQEDIDKAFGADPLARDDLRSLAVVAVAVTRSVSVAAGDPRETEALAVKDAVAFVEGLDAGATRAAAARLKDEDYKAAYEARQTVPGDPKAKVPWVAIAPEDKAVFEAGLAAGMGFKMACATIRTALATTPVEWLVERPKSWDRWSKPSGCGG